MTIKALAVFTDASQVIADFVDISPRVYDPRFPDLWDLPFAMAVTASNGFVRCERVLPLAVPASGLGILGLMTNIWVRQACVDKFNEVVAPVFFGSERLTTANLFIPYGMLAVL